MITTSVIPAGITDVVINLHYLGDEIINYFGDGRNLNLNIQYSMEQNLLGTGGALIQGKSFLDDSPFILLSGDLWTNYPFSLSLIHISSPRDAS